MDIKVDLERFVSDVKARMNSVLASELDAHDLTQMLSDLHEEVVAKGNVFADMEFQLDAKCAAETNKAKREELRKQSRVAMYASGDCIQLQTDIQNEIARINAKK